MMSASRSCTNIALAEATYMNSAAESRWFSDGCVDVERLSVFPRGANALQDTVLLGVRADESN